MHDIAEFEGRSIPGVGIASTELVAAAAAQAKSLGIDPKMVFVPHPSQDSTDAELRVLAENAVEHIVEAITARG